MAIIEHVGAREDGGAGCDRPVICSQKAAFARIYVFLGLDREAGDVAKIIGQHTIPSRTHCVRAVLNHHNAVAFTYRLNRFHIGDVTAHVGKHQKLGGAGLRLGG